MKLKKALSLTLALAMSLIMVVPAFAAKDPNANEAYTASNECVGTTQGSYGKTIYLYPIGTVFTPKDPFEWGDHLDSDTYTLQSTEPVCLRFLWLSAVYNLDVYVQGVDTAQPEKPTTPTKPEKPVEPQPTDALAKAGNQNIEIDGVKVPFQTYMLADANGNGTNYVKLRDIAHVLNGTGAQFSVGYNKKEKSISATTGKAYKDTGTEMDTPFAGVDKEYVRSQMTIVVDGTPVQLDAITLVDSDGNGYNYFQLRDLGSALDFKVGYSKARGVYIETK